MAKYQIADGVYELPDDITEEQLREVVSQLTQTPQSGPWTKYQSEPSTKSGNSERSAAPDRSFSSALKQSFAAPIRGIGQSLEEIGKAADANTVEAAGQTLQEALPEQTNYESAVERLAHPRQGDRTFAGMGYEYLPRAAVEQVGSLAGSLAARGAGAAALAPLGPQAAAVGAIAGPAAFGALAALGPTVRRRAELAGRESPNWEDWAWAAGNAGLQGALEAIGIKGLGKLNASIGGSIVRQGVTNTAQGFVQQGAETINTPDGLSIDPKLAVAEGLSGSVAGGTIHAGSKALAEANPRPATQDIVAASRLSSRIKSIADENAIDLTDRDRSSPSRASLAVDKAHTQITDEIRSLADVLKPALSDAVEIKALLRSIKNKNTFATDAELSKIDDRVGNTKEGQKLLELLREKSELTKIRSLANTKGGFSAALEKLSSRTLPRPLSVAGGLAAGMTLPHITLPVAAGGIAAYGIARGVDKITGRRNPLKRYVDSYSEMEPLSRTGPDLPSVVERTKKPSLDQIRRTLDGIRAEELQRSNQLADVVPSGGWGRRIFDLYGLTPQEMEAGLNILSNEKGVLSRADVARAVDDPKSLMDSKLGLAIEDALARLIQEGRLQIAREWKPQPAQVWIRNPASYEAAIKRHNDAIVQTQDMLFRSGKDAKVVSAARTGLIRLGVAKNAADAQKALEEAVALVSRPEDKLFIRDALSPLVSLKIDQ